MGGFLKFLGVLAILGTVVGFIPLLGWFNWLNIPFAVGVLLLGVLVWALNGDPGAKEGGKAAMVMGTIAILIGMVRLALGGGVV